MPGIPNPQIVDYFASEVGVLDELYKIQRVVDVMANENRTPEVRLPQDSDPHTSPRSALNILFLSDPQAEP
jgi:hypothetical protein